MADSGASHSGARSICREIPKTRDRSRQFQRKPMAIDCITMLVHSTDGVIKRMQDGTANKLHLPRRC